MNNKILIKTISEILAIPNYKSKCDGAGAVSLNVENKRIGISYNKGVFGLRLPSQIIGYVYFPEVETILEPYYKKCNLGYQPYTIYKSSRRFEHLSSFDLCIPDDIHRVSVELKTMVYDDILPFFEQFQNIHCVLAQMESLEKADVSKFICHSPVPRMMVLKRICDSKDWIEFCEWAVDINKTMAFESALEKPNYNLICDLYEKLKTI